MIDFLSGFIIEKSPTRIILENEGIGYTLLISTNTYQELPSVGDKTKLKTYLHVREDNMQLFAFASVHERTVFTGLISVSGIGPRLAQIILSGLKLEDLIQSIQNGDITSLTSISGVGTKTAQRLIVELREKFSQLGIIKEREQDRVQSMVLTTVEEEALMALISLGYKKHIVERALSKIRTNGNTDSVEELIKKTLKVI
jgi:Holliday junction DNA helicase RuvA